MKNKRVIIIAMDHPLDTDAHLRIKITESEKRAQRQSPRFSNLDIVGIQKEVNRNLMKMHLRLNGRYMGLLDLINFIKNNRQYPTLTPDNASKYYLLANMFTLNGVYLYQYLINEGYDPLVIQNFTLSKLPDFLHEKPLAVCISSTYLHLDGVKKIAEKIKAYDPKIPVIAGGILVKKILDAGNSLAPQTIRWISTFRGKIDIFIVESHGEQTLARLLKVISEGGEQSRVPNLALFNEKGTLYFTHRQEEYIDMDSTPIEWDRIPGQYLRKTLSVITSRGCAYRCRFCTYHLLFPKIHYKSIEILNDELRRIQHLGFVKHIRFVDDNFTANGKRLKSILKMMINEKFDFTWSAFARASSLTPEIIKLMKASGCDLLYMGLESGSSTILKNMDKKLDPRQAFEAIHMLKENGIASLGSFIFGFPGETPDTFHETVNFINESGLNYYQPYLFYTSKSLLIHEEREKFGLSGLGNAWVHNGMDAREASHLMSRMIYMIENGFTEGKEEIWETCKVLRGEGYSTDEISGLLKLKRDLYLALDERHPSKEMNPKVEKALGQIESRLK
ncbi:MAG: radical SAM protein [Pseudomonadota bacterium]